MYFIAKRIYSAGEAGRVSASAVRIATAGVAVGIMVMIISICVTVGFQREIKQRVAALVGHIQIINSQSLYRTYSVPIQITDSLKQQVLDISSVQQVRRFSLCPGMIKTDTDFRGVFFRGVEHGNIPSFISDNLDSGTIPSFTANKASSDSIMLSTSLARSLQIQAGDKVYAYFFDEGLRARRFVVAGTFCTNMADFDAKMCYADIHTVQKLTRWENDQYSGAEVMLHDFTDLESASASISQVLRMRKDAYEQYYASPCVHEMFPQIFSWLTLLDTNVVAILILMICVAGVTMISGLLIIILERTRFIGVMKAMGATNRQLQRTFLYLAAMIVLRGLFYGNILALALLFLQKQTQILQLDSASYYLSHVPVYFQWPELVSINVITLVVCVLILIVPSYLVCRIQPARSIKFE